MFPYSASHQLPSFLTERIQSFHYGKVAQTHSPPPPQNSVLAPLNTQRFTSGGTANVSNACGEFGLQSFFYG